MTEVRNDTLPHSILLSIKYLIETLVHVLRKTVRLAQNTNGTFLSTFCITAELEPYDARLSQCRQLRHSVIRRDLCSSSRSWNSRRARFPSSWHSGLLLWTESSTQLFALRIQ